MEIPTQSVAVTELDFDAIKASLIDYFKTQESPFKDWDYTGSGLNLLIDVLSHNTHYNALLAHMAVNESFIDSAQLRQNVVSAAKLIGYTPRSAVAAKATIACSLPPRIDSINEYVIPAGSLFSSNITDRTKNRGYRFTNLNDIICSKNSNGLLAANNVEIYQGEIVTKRIQINSAQSNNEYIIDDKNIDLNTLKVAVFQNGRSEINEVYSRFSDINAVDRSTPIYFIYENYNGNYVISFGNGVFGKRPDNLNILELSYLVTDGVGSNGSNIFSYSSSFDSTKITKVDIFTINRALGGADQESTSSIKYNAPLQYISQNRAVTADDYKTLIHGKFPNVKSISVWGGEENEPPQYGKVFVSIRKNKDLNYTSDFLTYEEKQEVLSYLSDKKVLSIFPEIVDPEYVNIVLDVLFKYNRNLTTYTKIQLENKVKETISEFNTQYLDSFDGVFRHSFLTKTIDNSNPSILNSHVRIYISKSAELLADSPEKITLKYGVPLTVDNDVTIINSTGWDYNGITYYIGDTKDDTSSDVRSLFIYYYDSNNIPIVKERNVGKITLSTGILELSPLFTDENVTLTLDLIPLSNDLAPKRNQLIQIDSSRLNVYGEVDAIAVGGSNRSVEYTTFSRDR
jgi:hypothetical protein